MYFTDEGTDLRQADRQVNLLKRIKFFSPPFYICSHRPRVKDLVCLLHFCTPRANTTLLVQSRGSANVCWMNEMVVWLKWWSPPPRGGINWDGPGYNVITSNPKFSAVQNNKSLFLVLTLCPSQVVGVGGAPLTTVPQRARLTELLQSWLLLAALQLNDVNWKWHPSLSLTAHWPELPTWPHLIIRGSGSTILSWAWRGVDPEIFGKQQ